MFGVLRCLLPPSPIASHRWSSVRMKRMLGGRGGDGSRADQRQESEQNEEKRAQAARGAGQGHGAKAMGEPVH